MKNSTLFIIAVVLMGFTANAQKFTVLPQVGVENPITRLSYNDLSSFKPMASQIAPTIGVRMDYKLMKYFGPFVGFTTSRPSVAYSFTNPETGMSNYTANAGNTLFQMQGGLQANTKPIYFKKRAAAVTKTAAVQNERPSYSRCGSYKMASRCGAQKQQKVAEPAPQSRGVSVRILPSAGIAYNPFVEGAEQKIYAAGSPARYTAGNFSTALLTGVGFEFGTEKRRLFTVNLNYFKGLGNNAQNIITESGLKTVTTQLDSKTSGWTASLGIPISLGKKPAIKQPEKKQYEVKPYRSSCTRRVI